MTVSRIWLQSGDEDDATEHHQFGSDPTLASSADLRGHHEPDRIPDADSARYENGRIQCQTAAEAAADVAKYLRIAGQRVRIHGGHRAPAAPRVDADDGVADMQLGAQSGVQGTPSLYIGGKKVRDRSIAGMSALVEEALKRAGSS